MIRRVLDILALLAVLNLFALGGLAAYAVSSGAINAKKARFIVAVMRGDEPLPGESQEAEEAAAKAEDESKLPMVPVNPVARTEMEKEILRREADRIKTELDQRLALNNSILLRVTTERERFRQEKAESARLRKARMKKRNDRGFKKELAILESLSPRVAVDHLLAMEDPEDAVQMLLQMQTGKAKKIVEAAKGGPAKEKMQSLLRRMRDDTPDDASAPKSNRP